nr:hypothetical protein [Tanacetum cinerariifolium]
LFKSLHLSKGGFFYSVWKPISLCLSMLIHRFVQLALNITPTDSTEYVVPSFTGKVAQTNPLEGPPIAPQADELMPDPVHAPNMEEPITSHVLKPVVQPVQTPSPIGSPSHLDIPSFGTTSTPQNIASTFDSLLSEAQFDAFTDLRPNNTMTKQLKIDALEKELKATKKLNKDTVLLFYKRIKKLEAKVKTKSKRKLVITADSSQKEDISPSMVEAAQILTGGKLDPSKISKSPAAIAQRSVQTFVRKSSSKSTQGLDYSDVDFSLRDSVATDSSILAEEVVPTDKGVSAASSNKGKGIAVELKAQNEEERKKILADLSKSDSEYAKQVAQTMETYHAEPAPQLPATGPLPSIERQRDLDDMIASFSNTEWMILMARVKDFPEIAKEILGADVNDDNFSSRLQALVNKRKSSMSIQRYRAQQAKPITRGDIVKFMRTYIKNMSTAYYSSGKTMEWANKFKGDDLIAEYNKIKSVVERSTTSQGVKRSGPTLEPGSPKKMKSTAGPSLGSTPADEVPADTGVFTDESVPADQRVPADQSVPADTSIPAGTCVSAKAATTTIPVNAPLDEDEPTEESSSLRREYPLEISVIEQLLDQKLQIEKDLVGNTITTAV